MVVLYSLTLLVSAALMFLVQPMFAKFVLPLFGSTPAVWNTSLLFFQAALLAGYAYAHAAPARLGVRRHAVLHLGVLVVAVVVLPIAVPTDWNPPADANPVFWLLGLLCVAVGLPFFAVASSAPLLQRWLASSDHRMARDPYFLYRASNLGSALGLLGYPLLLEPRLRLADQGRLWAIGYGLLILLFVACAIALWRSRPAPPGPEPTLDVALDEEHDAPPTARRRARWVLLAFVPSSYLLGVTGYVTTDIVPIPLLWVVPLALYLLTFVVVFSPSPVVVRLQRIVVLALPVVLAVIVVTILTKVGRPLWLVVPVHLLGFFMAALMLHGELARDRPAARHLTGFYLWIAVGGALGGVFNALLAPVAFHSRLEYPLIIVAAALLRPALGPARPGLIEFLTRNPRVTRWLDFAVPVLLGIAVAVALLLARGPDEDRDLTIRGVIFGLAAGLAVNTARRPLRFGLALGAVMLAGAVGLGVGESSLFRDRSFFGTYDVLRESDGTRRLIDGTTTHGAQLPTSPGRPPELTTYYYRSGPVGQIFGSMAGDPGRTARTAVIGLGTGSLACYARAGQRWTFYEIDPTVERIARDPKLFTYLRDCPGSFDVVPGDARRSLVGAPAGGFSTIVIDAFISDAIPVHLLTREAIELYERKLAPDGLVALNISNRYLNLAPVLGNLSRDLGLTCVVRKVKVTPAEEAMGRTSSTWAALARRPADLGELPSTAGWRTCATGPDGATWTDDFSNIFTVLRVG